MDIMIWLAGRFGRKFESLASDALEILLGNHYPERIGRLIPSRPKPERHVSRRPEDDRRNCCRSAISPRPCRQYKEPQLNADLTVSSLRATSLGSATIGQESSTSSKCWRDR